MASDIIVFGCINMDLILIVPRFPSPGETLAGTASQWAPGGKGANQALAATRAGASVSLIGSVGTDSLGESALELLNDQGTVLSEIFRSTKSPTGLAVIEVTTAGENRIVVVPGANDEWGHLQDLQTLIPPGSLVILQNEIPLEMSKRVLVHCNKHGIKTMYNPAPMTPECTPLLPLADILIVNETEALLALGKDPHKEVEAPKALLRELQRLGPKTVILTIGKRGALIVQDGVIEEILAYKVHTVDSTAAGDTYIGYLAAALVQGKSLQAACRWASGAAALAVQKTGAQPSIPTREETDQFSQTPEGGAAPHSGKKNEESL